VKSVVQKSSKISHFFLVRPLLGWYNTSLCGNGSTRGSYLYAKRCPLIKIGCTLYADNEGALKNLHKTNPIDRQAGRSREGGNPDCWPLATQNEAIWNGLKTLISRQKPRNGGPKTTQKNETKPILTGA
jgi:hypothetical protein